MIRAQAPGRVNSETRGIRGQATGRWIIRPFVDDDMDLVFTMWMRMTLTSPWGRLMSASTVHRRLTPIIETLVRHATVDVCCSSVDPMVINGFLVHERLGDPPAGGLPTDKPVMHLAFVRGWMRRLGIMSALLAHAGIDTRLPAVMTFMASGVEAGKKAHRTAWLRPWLKERAPLWEYDPYALQEIAASAALGGERV